MQHTADPTQGAPLVLLQGARRELCILTLRLEPTFFRDPAWLEALKRFLLASPRARARIFILDESGALGRAGALAELARRLPSRLELHTRGDEQNVRIEEEWLIADAASLWRRRGHPGAPEQVVRESPGEVRAYAAKFQDVWDHAQPSRELRDLAL